MPDKVTIELDKSVADALRTALDTGPPPPPPPVPPPPPEPPGGVTLTLEANADPYSSTASPGPWPIVHLLVGGNRVGQPAEINVNAQTGMWRSVTWTLPAAPADADPIAVRFTNDAADPTDWTTPGNDRNLHIKRLVLAVPGKPAVELTPATAVYRGDDGTVTSPAGEIMYREGLMVWRDAAPPPSPPPSPPVPPEPLPPGADFVAMVSRVDRPRLGLLDPRTVPWDQKPMFLREIVVDIKRGNDGAAGDEARPLKTLDAGQRRAGELGVGTRVMVRAGVYNLGTGRFEWGADGRPDAWFGFSAWPGERPKVRSGGWGAVQLRGSYFLLEGLDVDGSRKGYKSPWTGKIIDEDEQFEEECRARIGNGTNEPSGWDVGDGISIWGGMKGQNGRGVHHVIVNDCISHRWPGSGFNSSGMDYVLVQNCLSTGNCHWMGWGGSGISIFGARDLGRHGNEPHRIIVRANVVHANIQYKNTYGRENISDGGGIQFDVYKGEFDYQLRTLAHSNLSYNNGLSGMHSTSSGRIDYVGNTCWANNQHPQNRGKPEMWVGWDSPDCQFIGNILISGHGAVPLARVQLNGNVRTSRNNILSKATDFMGPGDVVADPRLIAPGTDPRASNFGIGPGSPAIGKGDALAAHDLFGAVKSPPDAGAIWLRAAVSPPPPPSPPPPAPPPPPPPVTLPGNMIEVAGNRLVYKGRDLRLIGPCMDALARIGDRSAADQTKAALRYVDVIRDEWNANVLRVHLYPTKWRAMVARGEGRAYLDALRNRARERGMWWMVDNHVVGAPDGAVSEWQDPQDGRVDWALELATQLGQWYGDDPSLAVFVGWDEPALFGSGQFAWHEMAPVHQRILDAYRAAGGKAIYGANGTHWARVYKGWRDHRITDPLGRMCVSFHDFEAAGRPGGEWQNFDQFMDGIHDEYPLFLIGLTIQPVDAAAPDADYAAWVTGKLRDLRPSVNPWGDAWADPKIYLDGWPNDAPTTWRPMGRWIRDAVVPAEIIRP